MNASLVVKSQTLFALILSAVACTLATGSKAEEPNKSATPAADPMRGNKAGQVRDDNGLKMKLVWCPPGFVTMGDFEINTEPAGGSQSGPDDGAGDPKNEGTVKPRPATRFEPVKVLLTKGYWLAKHELTQEEWKQVMNTEPWKGKDWTKEGADFPATFVDWNDATEFCRNFTEQERRAGRLVNDWEYRLPTEAEWERACRARTETRFSFGADKSKLGDYAWTDENTNNVGEPYAHRVRQKKANPWGLYDMYGNVAEWCRDIHVEKLPGGRDPEVRSQEGAGDLSRVFRGGCFSWDAGNCGSAIRNCALPSSRFSFLGFRVALCRVH